LLPGINEGYYAVLSIARLSIPWKQEKGRKKEKRDAGG
jgi:hypothetical protein